METRLKPRSDLHLLAWFVCDETRLGLTFILEWGRGTSPEVNFAFLFACLVTMRVEPRSCLLGLFVMRKGWDLFIFE